MNGNNDVLERTRALVLALSRAVLEKENLMPLTLNAWVELREADAALRYERPAYYDSPDNNAFTRANLGMPPQAGDPDDPI